MNAIGTIAVVAAVLGVFGTATAWPDIAVAVILAGLGVSGGSMRREILPIDFRVGRSTPVPADADVT
jgi:hypothetical protein